MWTKNKNTQYLNDVQFRIGKNQIFAMLPNSKVYYKAVKDSLWSIKWIGIYGNLAYKYLEMLGINYLNPVFDVKNPGELENILDKIFTLSISANLESKLECMALLHSFFAVLFQDVDINYHSEYYIESTINMMRFNYENSITVAEIAKELNINCNYFSKLFKRKKRNDSY